MFFSETLALFPNPAPAILQVPDQIFLQTTGSSHGVLPRFVQHQQNLHKQHNG